MLVLYDKKRAKDWMNERVLNMDVLPGQWSGTGEIIFSSGVYKVLFDNGWRRGLHNRLLPSRLYTTASEVRSLFFSRGKVELCPRWVKKDGSLLATSSEQRPKLLSSHRSNISSCESFSLAWGRYWLSLYWVIERVNINIEVMEK